MYITQIKHGNGTRFSLMELLLVTAIFLVLMSLLLPGVQRVRKHAKIARWYVRKHNLEIDPEVLLFCDFEEKTGTYIENKGGWAKDKVGQQGKNGNSYNFLDTVPDPDVWYKGARWVQGRWKQKGALLFDGVDDYVGFGNAVYVNQRTNETATFEAWICPFTTSGTRNVISTDNGGYDWTMRGQGATWRVFTGKDSLAEGNRDTGLSVDIGEWQHVVAVFAGSSKITFYKNGESVFINYIDYDSSVQGTNIGRSPDFGGYFAGIIDEAVVYTRALSPKEVQYSYEVGRVF